MDNVQDRSTKRKPSVKVYHGYGHTGSLVLYGHVFHRAPSVFHKSGGSFLMNFIRLIRLFLVKPLPHARLQLRFEGQVIAGKTEYDGFFRFEWSAQKELQGGYHHAAVDYLSADGSVLATGEGSIFVPHIAQYAFISDIDDTVMKSFSATVFRRMYELLARNPEQRRMFRETVDHYLLLSRAGAEPDFPNPFFYVSSSEWNLYDYLERIFRHNKLPEGVFLLNQIKRWFELFKTGHTGHGGKLIRISRILQAFPRQQFVLLGDNTQKDPEIYAAIAEKHPEQIFAIYIRNVRASRQQQTVDLLQKLAESSTKVCVFVHSSEAIAHGKQIGLIAE